MPRTFLGIDLGSSHIKLSRLELSGKRVTAVTQERLPRQAGASPEEVAASVRQAIEVMGLAASRTVLCLNSKEALLLSLDFPFTQSKKIAEVLPFELENQMPVDLESYAWDFLRLHRPESTASRILAAMYPKEQLQIWLQAFEAAGLSLDRIDLDLGALAGLALDTADELVDEELVLDVGWSKINLAHRHGRDIVCLHSSSPGLKRLFPADSADIQPDDQLESERPTGFSRGLDELIQQIRLAVLADAGGVNCQKITVLGGGAGFPELVQALQEEMGVPVEPLSRLPFDDQAIDDEPFLTGLSAGLCLQGGKGRRGFNLLPAELAGRSLQPLWEKHGRPMAIGLGLILLAWIVSLGSSIYLERSALQQLQSQLQETFRQAVPEAPEGLQPMQFASVLRSRLDSLGRGQSRTGPAVTATELLTAISRALPDDLTFQTTLLSFDEASLRLNGLAEDYKTVDSLQSALSGLEIFSSVEIIGANVDSRDEGVSFSLRLTLA